MNALNENLTEHSAKPHITKQSWHASLPYPSWPFGTVQPKELEKWGRRQAAEAKKEMIDNAGEALW